MKVIGSEYLNANEYKKIIISESIIKVEGLKGGYTTPLIKGMKTDYSKMPKEELVSSIINNFLMYHTLERIEFIGGNIRLICKDEILMEINTKLPKNLMDRITSEMNTNRELELEKTTDYEVNYGMNESGYRNKNVKTKFLIFSDQSTLTYDKNFLQSVLQKEFNNDYVELIEERDEEGNLLSCYILCDETKKKLVIDETLTHAWKDAIDVYNTKAIAFHEENGYQLRLFKEE